MTMRGAAALGVRRALRRLARWVDERQASLFEGLDASTPTPASPVSPAAQVAPSSSHEVANDEGPWTQDDRPHGDRGADGAAAPIEIFTHARGDRRVVLDGHVIGYAFVRARRRSIGMVVGAEGLSVRAPRWVSLREVDDALRERAAWILKHLRQARERAAQREAQRVTWADGASMPFLGSGVTLACRGSAVRSTRLVTASDTSTATLQLPLAPDADAGAIEHAALRWLQREARRHFEARLAHFAPQVGVRVTRLALSSARTRWGSAGSDGSIRLNWRLMHETQASVDYVVVHELAHLRHMNHSPAFWRVVESVLPDYRVTRKRLRERELEA